VDLDVNSTSETLNLNVELNNIYEKFNKSTRGNKLKTNIQLGAIKYLFYPRLQLLNNRVHFTPNTYHIKNSLLIKAIRLFFILIYKQLTCVFYKVLPSNLFDKKMYYLTLRNNKFISLALPYSTISKRFSNEPIFNKIYVFKNCSLATLLENRVLFSDMYILWQYYYVNSHYGFSAKKNFLVTNSIVVTLQKVWTNCTGFLFIVYFLKSLIRKKLNIKSLEISDRRHVVYLKSKRTNTYLGHSYKNRIEYGKSAGQYTRSKKEKKIKHFNYLLGIDFFKYYESWQKNGIRPTSTFFDLRLNSTSKFIKAILSAFLKNHKHISVNVLYFHNGVVYGLRKIRRGLGKYKRMSKLPYKLSVYKKLRKAKSILTVARSFCDTLQLWDKQKNLRNFMSLFRPLMSLRDYTSYAHGGCKPSQKKIVY
jgi:hypothetical protein